MSVFETTIRILGGLLSAYQLSGERVLLDQCAFPLHDHDSFHYQRCRRMWLLQRGRDPAELLLACAPVDVAVDVSQPLLHASPAPKIW